MPEPDKKPVRLEELLVSGLAQRMALAKLLIEKRLDYARKVHAEDCGGAGNVSEATESDSAMNIVKYLFGNRLICLLIPVVIGLVMRVRWSKGKAVFTERDWLLFGHPREILTLRRIPLETLAHPPTAKKS